MKENSDFKPVKFRFKTEIMPHYARAERLS